MTKVFIGGSRRIGRLDADVRRRIDRMIAKRLPIVMGDASGADKAVQRYLHERNYDGVVVFCADETPRNNLGGWPTRVVRPARSRRDFDYYATKDRAMAAEAMVGLMLWDGESRGTLLNVLRLAAQNKTAVVYVSPKRAFVEIRTPGAFEALVAEFFDRSSIRRLHEQAATEGRVFEQAQLRL